jgi:hypothetical protein
MECFRINGVPDQFTASAEYLSEGIYKHSCESGHETTTVLQEQLWEVLSNIGAYAIRDGYYREAVASYASCYERFHEFSIRVLMDGTDIQAFESAWRQVKNSSERQLGAFILLWTHSFTELPQLLTQKEIEFRNQVIHKGRIPTRAEALVFCSAVYTIIRSAIAALKSKKNSSVSRVIIADMRQRSTKGEQLGPTMSIPTVVTLNGIMADDFGQAISGIISERFR